MKLNRAISACSLAAALWCPAPTAAQVPADAWADTLVATKRLGEAREHHKKHEYTAEVAAGTEATEIYTRLYGPDHPKTAVARMYIARGLRELNREQEALNLYFQSLPAFEATNDTFRRAVCHHQIGLSLRKQFRFREAQWHAETALGLFRPDSARYAMRLADIQLGIGSALNAEARHAAAVPPLENARAVYASRGDTSGLGYCNYHLGNAWFGLHDFARAKEHYHASLALLKGILQPDDVYLADLYVKIGLCCQKTGESETGLQYLLRAKALYSEAGVEKLDYFSFLQELGQFYLAESQPEQAVEHFAQCLDAKAAYYGPDDFHLIGTLQLLGEALVLAKRYADAEVCYRRALQLVGVGLGGDYAFLFRIYGQLAELAFLQGDRATCQQRCDTAFAAAGFSLENPREVFPRDHFRELCLLYARALLGEWEQARDTSTLLRAEAYSARAAESLFREVQGISANRSREQFYDRDYAVLEYWLDVSMALFAATGDARQAEAAFQAASRGKAFLLAEAMHQNGALHVAGVPDSLLRAENLLRENIISAEKQLETAGREPDARTEPNLLNLHAALADWRQEHDALLGRIEREHPEYFRLRSSGRPVSSAELRRLLAPRQALLLYSQTATALYAFVCTTDTLCAVALPTGPDLPDLLERYRRALAAYHTHPAPEDGLYDSSLETCVAAGQALFRQLVAPVAALLPERVFIVPDGHLWRLPFGALLTGPPTDTDNFRTYPFWVLEKTLGYCLSPDLLPESAAPPKRTADKPWLGIAPFADTQPGADERFQPLPFSGLEVRAIAEIQHGEVWAGADATLERFRAVAYRYGVLHLASHGRADDRQGDYSFVVVGNGGQRLSAKDLLTLTLSADLVVLSACEAGEGLLLRGEGIIGLVRGFLYAGARSVVASQWLAQDHGNAHLMTEFYRNLQQGMAKDAALRSAQIGLIRQHPAYAHPFFWAGFRVYGDTGR